MDWLRRAGAMYRLRALLLLLSFALGSLIARDAAFLHQLMVVSAWEAPDDDGSESDAPTFAQAPPKLKARPKGISRRMAMNPWDPPDDDDELDEDSDSVAASHHRLAILPALLRQVLEADFVRVMACCPRLALAPRDAGPRDVSARGPPALT